jgi:hypothetical protein
MMRRLLDDERADGKVFSSLRASEAVIYGRFGFGLAGKAISVVIDPRRVPSVAGAADGTFRLLKPEEAMDVVPPLYARMSHRAGAVTRNVQHVAPRARSGGRSVEGPDHRGPHGHRRRRRRLLPLPAQVAGRLPGESYGVCELFDLFATSPAAELALWNYMVNLSLVRSIRVDNRPSTTSSSSPSPIRARTRSRPAGTSSGYACSTSRHAFVARCYGQSGEAVTIAVDDPWYPDNTATFRVASSGVERTTPTPSCTRRSHRSVRRTWARRRGVISWPSAEFRAATDDARPAPTACSPTTRARGRARSSDVRPVRPCVHRRSVPAPQRVAGGDADLLERAHAAVDHHPLRRRVRDTSRPAARPRLHHRYTHADVGRAEPDARWASFHQHEQWSLLCLEPPDHTRIGGFVSKVFTPKAVAGLRPGIEEFATEGLDHCAERLASDGEFDLLRDSPSPTRWR